MCNIAIIDDEHKAAEVLESMVLELFSQVDTLKIFTDPFAVVEAFQSWRPDLIFLDIKMPGMNGFDLLKLIDHHSFSLIFVTAYDEFALQAIKASALDYLLKPVDFTELKEVIQKFEKGRIASDSNRIENYYHNTKSLPKEQFRIGISSMERTLFFEVSEIIRCEAHSNYTFFFLQDGSKLLSSKTLKEHAELMNSLGFIRIHKSHLINPSFIKCINGKSLVELKDGSSLPIARRRRKEVSNKLSNFVI